jgi:hypothetical protein
MRDDMAQVIVERPRLPDNKSRKGRTRPLDELPSHESMRRPHQIRGEGKTLNENLRPLRRYLERQVGRPWDKIYAEIAANLRVDNTVQQHVRDHLRDFVAVQPRYQNQGWRSAVRGNTLWWQPLYVDPLTGLLCRTDRLPEEKARRKREVERKSPAPPERVPLAGDRELRRLHGLWYEVRLAPLPEPVYRAVCETQTKRLKPYDARSPKIEVTLIVRRLVTPAVRDVASGHQIEAGPAVDEEAAWKDYRRTHPDRRYAAAKRMLNRRELRRHGLANAMPEEIARPQRSAPPLTKAWRH